MAKATMPVQTQVNLEQIKREFGVKTWECALEIAKTMKEYLVNGKDFTGKMVFTVNCRKGGIGSTEAFVQKKI